MDAYRVIRHPGDEDVGAQWACRARQQRGPVEIASRPVLTVLRLGRTWLSASTGGRNPLIPPLVVAASRPAQRACVRGWESRGERMTEESYVTLSWNQLPLKFKSERLFRGRCIGSREGVFWF